jgi:Zn-dependent membrane protease YugP
MPFMFFDPTMILLLPALAFAIWAQFKVKSTYAKYAEIGNHNRLRGADAAELILRNENVTLGTADTYRHGRSSGIECIGGHLTDHYDPRSRILRLSEDVYNGASIAAVGIAAHEAGHSIQHAKMYGPMMLRNVVYPLCSIGSTLAFPLFFIGLFLPAGLGHSVIQAAIVLFSLAVFFTVLTLPVEFDASRRALRALAGGGYLTDEELLGAKKVLNAAAMTYVAAAAMAISELVRMLLIADRR